MMSATIVMLIPTLATQAISEEERRLIVSMMHCVVEWCLQIPIQALLEATELEKACLFNVFDVSCLSFSFFLFFTFYSIKLFVNCQLQTATNQIN